MTVTHEEDCLRVQCGARGCGGGEELKGTNIVVSSDAIEGKPCEGEVTTSQGLRAVAFQSVGQCTLATGPWKLDNTPSKTGSDLVQPDLAWSSEQAEIEVKVALTLERVVSASCRSRNSVQLG